MKYTERDIVRFALADHAFHEAKALAEHVADSDYDPKEHLFSASVAGIVVSYCRPFMSGSGLGPLSAEHSEFPSPELKSAHDLVVEARNKVTAHMDLLHVVGLHSQGTIQNHPGEILVHLTEQGVFFESTATYLNPNRIKGVIELCDFQSARVGSILAHIGADLLNTNRKLCTLRFRIHKTIKRG